MGKEISDFEFQRNTVLGLVRPLVSINAYLKDQELKMAVFNPFDEISRMEIRLTILRETKQEDPDELNQLLTKFKEEVSKLVIAIEGLDPKYSGYSNLKTSLNDIKQQLQTINNSLNADLASKKPGQRTHENLPPNRYKDSIVNDYKKHKKIDASNSEIQAHGNAEIITPPSVEKENVNKKKNRDPGLPPLYPRKK